MSKIEEILHKLTTEERNLIKNKIRAKDKQIQDLQGQLKNAIVPKFKIGQEVWFVDYTLESVKHGKIKKIDVVIYSDKICTYYQIEYVDFCIISHQFDKGRVFFTQAEAEQRLKELQGENK